MALGTRCMKSIEDFHGELVKFNIANFDTALLQSGQLQITLIEFLSVHFDICDERSTLYHVMFHVTF